MLPTNFCGYYNGTIILKFPPLVISYSDFPRQRLLLMKQHLHVNLLNMEIIMTTTKDPSAFSCFYFIPRYFITVILRGFTVSFFFPFYFF